jgi:hypothetical protein
MNRTEITLGVEDLPGELVLRRLVRQHRRLHVRNEVRGLQGEGYLKANLPFWNRAARSFPMLVLLDLDRGCAPGKRSAVLADPPHPNLLLRIAVVEVESWLLADHDAMAAWAGIPSSKLVADADAVSDPKQLLVNLVRRHGGARLKRLIVPHEGDRRQTAPGYNDGMRDLIDRHWDPDRAEARSPSLCRARQRIAEWRPQAEIWRQTT